MQRPYLEWLKGPRFRSEVGHMRFRNELVSTAMAATLMVTLILPASAQIRRDDQDDRVVVAPVLLTDPEIDWMSGSSEWLDLKWTAPAELENVRVVIEPRSPGLEVAYPANHDGFSSLANDEDLAPNEIDSSSVKLTTTDAGAKQAFVRVYWDHEGQSHDMVAGRLRLSDDKYQGKDFEVLTEVAEITTDAKRPEKNWVELSYKGLAPTTTNIWITVAGHPEIYHPRSAYGYYFTSLHGDQTLRAGETDLARIWFDPEKMEPGEYKLIASVHYRDHSGILKTKSHKVLLKVTEP